MMLRSTMARRPDCAHQVEPRFCCTHGPLCMYSTECCVVKLCIVLLLVVVRVLELTCMCTTLMFMYGVDNENDIFYLIFFTATAPS
jgi:hypothetical protein